MKQKQPSKTVAALSRLGYTQIGIADICNTSQSSISRMAMGAYDHEPNERQQRVIKRVEKFLATQQA